MILKHTFIYYLEKNGVPFYIGKSNKPNERCNNHKIKYGRNISLQILDEIENKKEIWKFWETFYIDLFHSWGFNLSNIKRVGGSGPHCHSEETKQKISLSNIGKKGWNKGKKLSEETKQKISERGKGKIKPGTSEKLKGLVKKESTILKIRNNMPNSSKVYQYDIDGTLIKTWNSIKETERNNKGNIKNCILGKTKTANGFIWIREKDNSELNERIKTIQNYINPLTGTHRSDEYKQKLSQSIKGKKSNYKQNNLNLKEVELKYNVLGINKLSKFFNVSVPTMLSFLKNNKIYKFRKNYMK